MKRKLFSTSILTLFVFILFSFTTFANKTSVKIDAPEKVKAGTEVTIKIEVKHVGNTSRHYSDWVIVKINGEEYKKWEYSSDNLPTDQNFILEFKVKVEKNMEIIAEGNCNKHGSKGTDKVNITIE
jgi:desulfoferrodoxin (superoxide reductase-like protein)